MKLELLIILVTIFFVVNTYYDGKIIQIMKGWKKYYQMIFVALAGICVYIFIRKNPNNSRELFTHANNFVKYMPIDKDAGNMLTPILDFTSRSFYDESGMAGGAAAAMTGGAIGTYGYTPQQKRMLNSGTKATKRSVSETKKKYVAAQQAWTCDHCKLQLPAWFEVDHKIRLEYGGSNHIDNLVALCRNCHGKKTALENL